MGAFDDAERRLVDNARSPAALAQALTAPSSLLVAGAATALTIVTGAPLVLAAVVGVAAWGVKTVFGVRRATKPKPVAIDPFRVGEPWRQHVQSALQAQVRFQRAITQTRSGPLRDRLKEIGRRVDEGVHDVWQIAQQAYALDNAVNELDVRGTRIELRRAETELAEAGDPAGRPGLQKTVESIKASLASAERLAALSVSTRDRLRQLDAQLDELVARAIELSLQTGSEAELTGLSTDVESVVTEMEALRQAMEETSRGGYGSPGGLTATA